MQNNNQQNAGQANPPSSPPPQSQKPMLPTKEEITAQGIKPPAPIRRQHVAIAPNPNSNVGAATVLNPGNGHGQNTHA